VLVAPGDRSLLAHWSLFVAFFLAARSARGSRRALAPCASPSRACALHPTDGMTASDSVTRRAYRSLTLSPSGRSLVTIWSLGTCSRRAQWPRGGHTKIARLLPLLLTCGKIAWDVGCTCDAQRRALTPHCPQERRSRATNLSPLPPTRGKIAPFATHAWQNRSVCNPRVAKSLRLPSARGKIAPFATHAWQNRSVCHPRVAK